MPCKDQPEHLIRVFAVSQKVLCILCCSQCQTALICWLIWVFAGQPCNLVRIAMPWLGFGFEWSIAFHLFCYRMIQQAFIDMENMFELLDVGQEVRNILGNIYSKLTTVITLGLLYDREVVSLIPGRVIPRTLKMVLAALSLGAQC